MSQPAPQGTADQILMKLGEMGAQLAVMNEKLNKLPDHETRIRSLEAGAQQDQGGRDYLSRWLAALAAVAAAAAAAGVFLH